ncbi:hypothetical protein PG993_000655 [Apiospora rasikravindrae]|uniref:Uncharacterized protein n=1 Tax=Apiospora rasikravindrae TaxID=990691 RepID=A0ABR1UBX8_9PEZI
MPGRFLKVLVGMSPPKLDQNHETAQAVLLMSDAAGGSDPAYDCGGVHMRAFRDAASRCKPQPVCDDNMASSQTRSRSLQHCLTYFWYDNAPASRRSQYVTARARDLNIISPPACCWLSLCLAGAVPGGWLASMPGHLLIDNQIAS